MILGAQLQSFCVKSEGERHFSVSASEFRKRKGGNGPKIHFLAFIFYLICNPYKDTAFHLTVYDLLERFWQFG